MNTHELEEVTRSSHAALDAEVAQLTDEQMLTPGVIDEWTMKDALAHISAWERLFVGWIEAMLRGEMPDRPQVWTDEWTHRTNAKIYAENRDRTLDQVRAEARASHEAVLEIIKPLFDDARFDREKFPTATLDSRIAWLRANADEHYDEHREQIANWRAQAGSR